MLGLFLLWFFPGFIRFHDIIILVVTPSIVLPCVFHGFMILLQRLDRMEENMRNLAARDPLTGVYNRRQFMHLAQIEWQRSNRYGRALSVLMLDIDFFKCINDSHGHPAGDRVIQLVADICSETLRQQDWIGRYGGEEFCILLPETSSDQAAMVAERMRQKIESTRIMLGPESSSVTVSIGSAERSAVTNQVEDLIGRADSALYEAKRKGRNLVMQADQCEYCY